MYPLQMSLGLQTKDSVVPFLQQLGKCPDIFSIAMTADGDYPFYLYAAAHEVVIVTFDCEAKAEIADEKPFMDEKEPLYFSEDSHRTSPVFSLREKTRDISKAAAKEDYHVSYLLLTTCDILNKEDWKEKWLETNVTVVDNMPATAFALDMNTDFRLPAARAISSCLKDVGKWPDEMKETEDDDEREGISPDELATMLQGMGTAHRKPDTTAAKRTTTKKVQLPSGLITLSSDRKVQVPVLPPMESPMETLSNMVGLNDIREAIDDLECMAEYNRRLKALWPDGKQHQMALHAVFKGNPGTGKTTVAKAYGALLHEAGALSTGHVMLCDRSCFVGNCHGDEETMVRELLRQAKGGVLVIDEAYQLNGNHPSDPGKLVLPLFMNALADEGMRDIAVIICGYPKEMDRLMETNPGLESRFPNRLDFPDFSLDDLLRIAERRMAAFGYHATRQAKAKMHAVIKEAYDNRDARTWGNARYVANLLQRVFLLHARRCRRLPDRCLFTITTADIEALPAAKGHDSIGFRSRS